MRQIVIDINCDVGEGIENEPKLFPFISSCNIACGGHTGDKDTMLQTIRLAKENQVKIGAHPSYPDKNNFGRVSMNMDPGKLSDSIKQQLHQLHEICTAEGVTWQHIKPHGALYNDIAKDGELASVFLESIEEYKSDVVLFVPYGSAIQNRAKEQGFETKIEAFADRNYNDGLSLVSRSKTNALIKRPEEVLHHIVRMAREKKVLTVNNELKPIQAETYCIHGDTPEALQILMYITQELPKHHIVLSQ